MHQKKIVTAGIDIKKASKVLVLIHGRGGSAEDMISFSEYLSVNDFALLAPEATNNIWYPYSFLSPPKHNEPWLSSALALLEDVLNDIIKAGISADNIFFSGFSQGACLMLEFAARNASKYGGIISFTGGLIGDKIYRENYKGNFMQTPVFIGSSNPDPHVPVERVYATVNILKEMGAKVIEKIYNNMGHTINEDEIKHANMILQGASEELKSSF